MKHALALVLVALLAWGVWQIVGGDEAPTDAGLGGGSLLDEPLDEPGDLKGAAGQGAEGMRTVGDGGTRPRVGSTPGGRPDEDAIELVGRVVDTRRMAVGGAAVELQAAGKTVARATSGPDGVYRLRARAGPHGRAVRGTLLARREGYGATAAVVWLAEGGDQAGPTLVLERAWLLRARVEVDGAASGFANVAVARREGGQVTPFGTRAAGTDGAVVFDGLAAGLYEVFATLPGRGRGHASVRLPQPEGEVAVLRLGGERLLDVIVEDAATGEAIPGALVEVGEKRTLPKPTGPGYLPPLPSVRTNGAGRATVRGLGLEETIHVNVEAAGYVPALWWQASSQIARPGTSEVVVRMRRPRRVTFPIYPGEAGAPADGTALRVELAGRMGADVSGVGARVDGEYVVVDGLPPLASNGALVAPGGLQARFSAPMGVEMGNAVEFVAPRTVRIRIVEPGGGPVEGVALRLNPLDGTGRSPSATTGADGVATFEGIAADKAGVHLRSNDTPWGGPLLGRIDLTGEQEEFTFELVARFTFVLHVRVGDERRLPPSYSLTAGGSRVASTDIAEDPAAGQLQVSLRPPQDDAPFPVQLLAEGYLPASVEVDPSDEAGSYDVVLAVAGRIVARVTPPEDESYALALERFDPATKGWSPTVGGALPGTPPQPSGDGVHEYEGLESGRYRLTEARSGYRSDPIDVQAGGAPVEVAVDLAGAVDVVGRVKAPPGSNLAQARVRVLGRHDPAQPWSGVRVAADGTFVLRALRGATLELAVFHPLLSPAAEGGRVRVVAGTSKPVLALEAGAEAVFRVAGFEGANSAGGSSFSTPVQVKLYRGEVGGELVVAVQPQAVDGVFSFGGFPEGTYALWLGFGTKYAPYVKSGVALGSGRTDLGSITPPAGETLVVELTGGDDKAQAVWATVSYRGEPSYARHGTRAGEAPSIRVPGLGKGTFEVVVRTAGGGGTRVVHEGELSLDGSGETRLTVDLR